MPEKFANFLIKVASYFSFIAATLIILSMRYSSFDLKLFLDVLFSAAFIAAGLGLIKRKEWGRVLFLWTLGAHIVPGFWGYSYGGILNYVPWASYENVMLGYLNSIAILTVMPLLVFLIILSGPQVKQKFS